MKKVPGVTSALAERVTGGRYIDVDIDRDGARPLWPQHRRRAERRLGRHRRRQHRRDRRGAAAFPDQPALSARTARFASRSCATCRSSTERGAQIRLGDVAQIRHQPTARRCCSSENARLSGWVYVDLHGRDLSSAVHEMQQAVAQRGADCRPAIPISWSGQFEYLERATQTTQDRRAGHAADHLRPALPDFRRVARSAAASWRRCPSRWSAGSGSCTCSATTCRSHRAVGFIALGWRRRRDSAS